MHEGGNRGEDNTPHIRPPCPGRVAADAAQNGRSEPRTRSLLARWGSAMRPRSAASFPILGRRLGKYALLPQPSSPLSNAVFRAGWGGSGGMFPCSHAGSSQDRGAVSQALAVWFNRASRPDGTMLSQIPRFCFRSLGHIPGCALPSTNPAHASTVISRSFASVTGRAVCITSRSAAAAPTAHQTFPVERLADQHRCSVYRPEFPSVPSKKNNRSISPAV